MDGYLGTQMMLPYPIFLSLSFFFFSVVKFNRRGRGALYTLYHYQACLLQQAMMETPILFQFVQSIIAMFHSLLLLFSQ